MPGPRQPLRDDLQVVVGFQLLWGQPRSPWVNILFEFFNISKKTQTKLSVFRLSFLGYIEVKVPQQIIKLLSHYEELCGANKYLGIGRVSVNST